MKKKLLSMILAFLTFLVLSSLFVSCIILYPYDSTSTDKNGQIIKPSESDSVVDSTITKSSSEKTDSKSDDDPEYEAMDFFKEDVSQWVTLGQWQNMKVEVSMLEVPEDYIDKQINVALFQSSLYTKVEEGTVTDGVIFNFDYTGYINGVRFEGGSATNTSAYIDGNDFITVTTSGTGMFIDGFAQGTLGAKVGETIDVNVTFPENYSEKDYAGKEAVFKVKINYIYKTELTDENASTLSSKKYTTAESFRAYLKDYIDESLEENNIATLWGQIVKNATFIEIPEQEFNYMFNAFKSTINSLTAYGITYEQALQYYGFADEEELKEYTNDLIKSELVVYAIMQANEIDASDEEIAAKLTELAKEAEKTEDEFVEAYGMDYVKQKVMLEKTDALVLGSNTFVLETDK